MKLTDAREKRTNLAGYRKGKGNPGFNQQLDSVPVRNTHVSMDCSADGELSVRVELKYPPLVAPVAKLMKLRTEKTYILDPVGAEVYEYVDGERTFENIIDLFAKHHKLTFFESRSLTAQYLQLLMKRGLIVVGLERPCPVVAP